MKVDLKEISCKILLQLYRCQTTFPDGSSCIIISQAEISRILGVSTITINKYIKQFQKDNLISPKGEIKGKYQFTEKGLALIKKIEEIERI